MAITSASRPAASRSASRFRRTSASACSLARFWKSMAALVSRTSRPAFDRRWPACGGNSASALRSGRNSSRACSVGSADSTRGLGSAARLQRRAGLRTRRTVGVRSSSPSSRLPSASAWIVVAMQPGRLCHRENAEESAERWQIKGFPSALALLVNTVTAADCERSASARRTGRRCRPTGDCAARISTCRACAADAAREPRSPRACSLEQRRQEAVHVIEARQLEERRPMQQLDAAAGVGRAIAQQPPPYGIGDTR